MIDSRRVAVAVMALAVAACGSRTGLTPAPGESLPVAPYGREDRLTAEELLTRPPQAAPERSVELRKRSEERQDDPFDLPPEEGPRDVPAAAPRVPLCADEDPERLAACTRPDRGAG